MAKNDKALHATRFSVFDHRYEIFQSLLDLGIILPSRYDNILKRFCLPGMLNRGIDFWVGDGALFSREAADDSFASFMQRGVSLIAG